MFPWQSVLAGRDLAPTKLVEEGACGSSPLRRWHLLPARSSEQRRWLSGHLGAARRFAVLQTRALNSGWVKDSFQARKIGQVERHRPNSGGATEGSHHGLAGEVKVAGHQHPGSNVASEWVLARKIVASEAKVWGAFQQPVSVHLALVWHGFCTPFCPGRLVLSSHRKGARSRWCWGAAHISTSQVLPSHRGQRLLQPAGWPQKAVKS